VVACGETQTGAMEVCSWNGLECNMVNGATLTPTLQQCY
jgi:hypothetical protein